MSLAKAIGGIPRWHWDALCGTKGKLWAKKTAAAIAEQKQICGRCPVRQKCADAVAAMSKGGPDLVMAGLTRDERLDGDLVFAERQCNNCTQVKRLSEFPRRARDNGRSMRCKDCTNAAHREQNDARKTRGEKTR
ncbi:WhiB family transcriptional regulator [Microbispora amethystogenes]|uniref:WhiB family transcriptional regulator n=1 Tax=Microbispora amethystogenes TaxID=1427754 RepID=UPI00340F401D